MLNSLYIENVAVIEKTDIEFGKGFNVLTGATGAGKSIIIGSINALLGGKISKDMIRSGTEFAFVSGSFSCKDISVIGMLSEYGYDVQENEELILQRKLSLSGKSSCRINGRPVTLSVLREIAGHLVNIHGQHESYNLMSPERHISYIDSMGNLAQIKEEYRKNLAVLRECKRKLSSAKSNTAQREREIDLLRYQVNEIEDASLQEGEYEALNDELKKAKHAKTISDALNQAEKLLLGDGEYSSGISDIRDCAGFLNGITEYIPEAETLGERIMNAFYELQDCSFEISSVRESIDTDPYRIEEIEERLNVLYKLSKKYGETTKEILEFAAKSRERLEYLEEYEYNMDILQNEYDKYFQITKKLALELSEKRREISSDFMSRVKNEMTYLDMPNVNLKVSIERCPLNENGCDKLEFLISANPGEAPKPVSKIASGGELSRMMLAITNVIASNNIVETMIFDEVDTGISGSASQKVGYKLKELSKTRQVICITHQAQIASLADEHFLIEKNVSNDRTFTTVSPLDMEQRKYELARIIGGVSITELTLRHAEEMLTNN